MARLDWMGERLAGRLLHQEQALHFLALPAKPPGHPLDLPAKRQQGPTRLLEPLAEPLASERPDPVPERRMPERLPQRHPPEQLHPRRRHQPPPSPWPPPTFSAPQAAI